LPWFNNKNEVVLNLAQVSGRVIIDAYAFYIRQEISLPDLARIANGMPSIATEPNAGQRDSRSPASEERKEEMPPLRDLECILAVPRVRGFDLMTKEWCE
jgi:hypothetical protein